MNYTYAEAFQVLITTYSFDKRLADRKLGNVIKYGKEYIDGCVAVTYDKTSNTFVIN